MGKIRIAIDVKLFIAITYSNDDEYEEVKKKLEDKFGNIDVYSVVYDFIYTQYYSKEMGFDLKKQFIGFKKLIPPENLVDIKLFTNEIEDKYSINCKRKLNIDPGYLSPAKVVLATTKNFDHRLYLGKGIFGDVHLRYRGKKYHCNDWTYPDYRDLKVIDFLARLRKVYMKEYRRILENLNKENKF